MGLPDSLNSIATAPGGTGYSGETYITSVLLLCVECRAPIKATITTPQWVRVEWIGPSGECQACNQKAKDDNR